MTIKTRGFDVGMWVALTTAGVVAATLIGRERHRRRVSLLQSDAHRDCATQADSVIDETLEDSFPASDPPAWSGIRAR